MNIKLIATGGTIDKKYNHLNGELIFSETSIYEMLRQARSTLEINAQVLMLKDSLYINDEDRNAIAEACNECSEQKIIITHGTDTMVDTAEVLAKKVAVSRSEGKTIVLLGAMVPFQFKESDALFNLGAALAAVQSLPAGVYITMNGHVFEYNQVRKNRDAGEFQFVNSQLSEYKAD